MKFFALVPQRESNIQTVLGAINKLPDMETAVSGLKQEIDAEKQADLPIMFDSIYMNDNGTFSVVDIGSPFQYTRHALSQSVVRIKPEEVVGMAGYLAACPPDLRATNFNFWHQENYGPEAKIITKNDVMLRTRFGEDGMPIIRALVSQSYVPIDDLPLMKQFLEVIPEGAHVRSARGDLRSRFDVIWPTMKKSLSRGEPLLVAVRLLNSETGVSSVRLEPMVYSNNTHSSIIIPTNNADVSIRHIGEAGDKLVKRFDTVTSLIDPFMEMLNMAYSDGIADHFKDLAQLRDCIKKAFSLNESTMKRFSDNMYRKDVRADVVEALSRTADELPIEAGEELQRAAGLLTMKGWRLLKKYIDEE